MNKIARTLVAAKLGAALALTGVVSLSSPQTGWTPAASVDVPARQIMELVVTPDCEWVTFEDGASGWNCDWMPSATR